MPTVQGWLGILEFWIFVDQCAIYQIIILYCSHRKSCPLCRVGSKYIERGMLLFIDWQQTFLVSTMESLKKCLGRSWDFLVGTVWLDLFLRLHELYINWKVKPLPIHWTDSKKSNFVAPLVKKCQNRIFTPVQNALYISEFVDL